MKRSFLLTAFVISVFSIQGQQILKRVTDRAKNRAEANVNSKVDNAVDKTVDEAMNPDIKNKKNADDKMTVSFINGL